MDNEGDVVLMVELKVGGGLGGDYGGNGGGIKAVVKNLVVEKMMGGDGKHQPISPSLCLGSARSG